MKTAFLSVAHRGGRGLFPENSLPSVANAVRLGWDAAEIDVQLSKDGRVFLYDGARLNADYCRRPTGEWISRAEATAVRDLTYEQLREYDIGLCSPASSYAKQFPFLRGLERAKIPLLSEVIELVRTASSSFLLVIDLKTPVEHAQRRPWVGLVDAVVQTLRDYDFVERTVLASRDWGSLIYAKTLLPSVKTWFATMPASWFAEATPPPGHSAPSVRYRDGLRRLHKGGKAPWYAGFDPGEFDHVQAAIRAAGGDGWFVHFSDFGREQALQASEAGLSAIVWSGTRNDPVVLQRLVAVGADGFCGDYPDLKPASMAIDVASLLERAAAAHERSEWSEVIAQLRCVSEHFPHHVPCDVFVKLAIAQRMAKDLVAARASLESCRRAYPGSLTPLVEMAVTHMHAFEWEKALPSWEELLELGIKDALDYNRAARTCEVVQRWELHARIVAEGLAKFPHNTELRARRLYGDAQAMLAQGRWDEAVQIFGRLEIPRSWPFAVSYYSAQAEIERALACTETDAERNEVLHSAQSVRTSVPKPAQLAGLVNALEFGRRRARIDAPLADALLRLLEVAKNYDVDFKDTRSAWASECAGAVARAAAPAAVASLDVPSPYLRTLCRILLRFGHFQAYWLFRERYLELLDLQSVDRQVEPAFEDLLGQVLLANERADGQCFTRLRDVLRKRFSAISPKKLRFLDLSSLYHSRAPLDWTLPFDDAEQSFAELVSGRSVAVVGPVASEEDCGEEIDGFDLVVRFNHRASLHYEALKFGRRTNLSWYIQSDLPADALPAFVNGMNDLDFVVLDKWCWEKCRWLDQVRTPKRGRLECWMHDSNPLLFGNPNGVQRTLLDLLRFNVRRVKVFASNLFLDSRYAGGYRAPQKNLLTALCLHDPVGNFVLLKRLRKLGSIETDSRLGGILSMSAKEYVDALEVRYGCNIASKRSGDPPRETQTV